MQIQVKRWGNIGFQLETKYLRSVKHISAAFKHHAYEFVIAGNAGCHFAEISLISKVGA